MDLAYSILHYLGLALLVVAGVFTWFFFKKVKEDKPKLKLFENYKKNYLYATIGIVALIFSFVVLEVSFYTPGKNNFMIDHSFKTYAPGRLALSYIFVILAAVSWVGIVFGYFTYKHFKEEDEKIKKYSLLTWSLSIPAVIISTILFLEGSAPYLQYPLVNSLHIGKQGIELVNNYLNRGPDFKGLNIAFYAIFILGGAFTVLLICDHFMFKFYKHHGLLYTCFFIAVPCGIIGARLWYVCIDLLDYGAASQFYMHPENIFKIWEGGLAIMGGAVLGIIGGVTVMIVLTYVMKKPIYKDLKLLHVMDIIVPTILIAQAIGRWGNFFNNEVYGFEVSRQAFCFLPTWITNNMRYKSHAGAALPADRMYLPLFLIESLTNTAGYFFIYFGIGRGFFTKYIIKFINLFSSNKDNLLIKEESYHANGTCLGWYLFWYGCTRAIMEPLRTSTDMYESSLITSYILMGVGLAIVLFFILFDVVYTRGIRVQRLANTNIEVPFVAEENEEDIEKLDVDNNQNIDDASKEESREEKQ